jgi:hypothetical protein
MTDSEDTDDIRTWDEVNYNASEEWCYVREGHMTFLLP